MRLPVMAKVIQIVLPCLTEDKLMRFILLSLVTNVLIQTLLLPAQVVNGEMQKERGQLPGGVSKDRRRRGEYHYYNINVVLCYRFSVAFMSPFPFF